jgi:hypothetical protein
MFKLEFKKKVPLCNILGKGRCTKETGFNPILTWRIILAVFFPLIILVGFFSWHSYSILNAEDFMAVLPNTPIRFETIDKNSLEQVVKFFENRQATTTAIISNPTSVLVDPSL